MNILKIDYVWYARMCKYMMASPYSGKMKSKCLDEAYSIVKTG